MFLNESFECMIQMTHSKRRWFVASYWSNKPAERETDKST